MQDFIDNQANVLPKRTQNKYQEIYYSNNVCMMQSSLDVLVVIAMVKEGFHFVGVLCWWKKEVKVGSQKEMFLLCCETDLPRVKEKRWWQCGILQQCIVWQMYNHTKWRKIHWDHYMQNFAKQKCQCTETCKMDFCYVLFIYLTSPN